MPADTPKYTNVEEYIALHSPPVQEKLREIRRIITQAAPQATETISWQMPTYVQHGNLVHFAAHKTHIGFYPGAEGVSAFTAKLEPYHTSKGAIQFPLTQPLPEALIREIVLFRVKQNTEEAEQKAQQKKRK